MTFADFRSPALLTDEQAAFVAAKYRVVSLEKCTGAETSKTEEAIYTTAAQLKKINPSVKVLFYLNMDFSVSCYKADDEYKAHPEWNLKADDGSLTSHIDTTNADARAWWTSIPLKGDGNGSWKGQPVSQLIDGVLADGGQYHYIANVSQVRLEAIADAKMVMIQALQQQFTKLNGGIVMANGISMYGGVNVDPRFPNNYNLRSLNFANAIMNEHTAVFEDVSTFNASLKVETVSRNLDAVVAASQAHNGSKAVFLQTWPGLYSSTDFYPSGQKPANVYPTGGEPTPQDNQEWRESLRKHFTFAHAIFLSVAEANTYWYFLLYCIHWYT
jgi:hypothetical protein